MALCRAIAVWVSNAARSAPSIASRVRSMASIASRSLPLRMVANALRDSPFPMLSIIDPLTASRCARCIASASTRACCSLSLPTSSASWTCAVSASCLPRACGSRKRGFPVRRYPRPPRICCSAAARNLPVANRTSMVLYCRSSAAARSIEDRHALQLVPARSKARRTTQPMRKKPRQPDLGVRETICFTIHIVAAPRT